MDPSLSFTPPNPVNNPPNVTQLDFHQSMNHFKTMFPGIDEDVIETVLRSNQGAVDATIDQLLQISSENQNTAPTNPPSYTATVHSSSTPHNLSKNLNLNSTPKEKVHKSTLNQLIDFDTIDAQACAGKPKSRFNPPLIGPLPNDFLRITSPQEKNSSITSQQQSAAAAAAANQNLIRQSSTSSGDHQFSHDLLKKKMEENERQRSSNIDDKEIAQYLEDERIAIMLQNREFVSELKRNKEFMSALNYDAMSHNTTRVKSLHSDGHAGAAGGGGYDSQGFTDADFRERIKRMGEASKKKFAQLAGLFSRRKGSGLASRDNLLGDQYATLENDCSDSEEFGHKKPFAHPGRH